MNEDIVNRKRPALIHRLLSLPDIDASHPGKEVVIIEIAGRGGGRAVVRM